jgi:hypothetical protein
MRVTPVGVELLVAEPGFLYDEGVGLDHRDNFTELETRSGLA